MTFLRFSFGLGKRSGEDEYANFVPPPEVIPRNSMFGLHKRGVEAMQGRRAFSFGLGR